jgi:hypothetical protein
MKNSILGIFFIIISNMYIIQSQKLSLGSLTKMGPAFFASMLSYFLLLLGIILIIKSFLSRDKNVVTFNYKIILLTFFCIFIFVYFVNLIPFWFLLICIFIVFTVGSKFVF